MSKRIFVPFAAALLATFTTACVPAAAGADVKWGVNESGLEFGTGPIAGTNFVVPDPTYYLRHGVEVVRVPFKLSRLQPVAGGPLNPAYVQDLRSIIAKDSAANAITVLDPQGFGFYDIDGKAHDILTDPEAAADYLNMMTRIAETFGKENVAIGLMNEPHTGADTAYAALWNRAIADIRRAGYRGIILVPHAHWSNAGDIKQNRPYTGHIIDPENNWALELHLYMDADSTGTYRKPTVSAEIGVQRLDGAIAWSRQAHIRIFLGETNAPATPVGLAALRNTLAEVAAAPDVFWGVALWGAGPWWKPDYPLRLDPINGTEQPQLSLLEQMFKK
jgi:endoglucanase